MTSNLIAIHARHANIAKHNVGYELVSYDKCTCAIISRYGIETVDLQQFNYQVGSIIVVINNEYSTGTAGGFHVETFVGRTHVDEWAPAVVRPGYWRPHNGWVCREGALGHRLQPFNDLQSEFAHS